MLFIKKKIVIHFRTVLKISWVDCDCDGLEDLEDGYNIPHYSESAY